MSNIAVGDPVEEVDTDSGLWVVVEVYRNTLSKALVAKLSLPGRPDCTTHVGVERLRRVGPWR